MQIRRSPDEIHDVANWAAEHAAHGETDHEDGSYEEGVLDALRWLTGETDARPDE